VTAVRLELAVGDLDGGLPEQPVVVLDVVRLARGEEALGPAQPRVDEAAVVEPQVERLQQALPNNQQVLLDLTISFSAFYAATIPIVWAAAYRFPYLYRLLATGLICPGCRRGISRRWWLHFLQKVYCFYISLFVIGHVFRAFAGWMRLKHKTPPGPAPGVCRFTSFHVQS
jgi:hypothetical protein